MKRGRMCADRRISVFPRKLPAAGDTKPADKESVTNTKRPLPPTPIYQPPPPLNHPPSLPPPPLPPRKKPVEKDGGPGGEDVCPPIPCRRRPKPKPREQCQSSTSDQGQKVEEKLPPPKARSMPPPLPEEDVYQLLPDVLGPTNKPIKLPPPPPPRVEKSEEVSDEEYYVVPEYKPARNPAKSWLFDKADQRKKSEETHRPRPPQRMPAPLPGDQAASGPLSTDPKEKDSLTKLQRDVDETKTLMQTIIGAALHRGNQLDELVVRSESLGKPPHTSSKASEFREQSLHDAAIQRYNEMVLEYEGWIRQACQDIEEKALGTYSLPYLIEQIRVNEKLKTDIAARLAQLNDMEVECERLCKQETPDKSHHLRASVTYLREDTEQLQLKAGNKQVLLQKALKETEKQREELNTQLRSEQHLKKTPRAEDTKSEGDKGDIVAGILQHAFQFRQKALESSLWSDNSDDSLDWWSDSEPEPCEGFEAPSMSKTVTKKPVHSYVRSGGHEKIQDLAASSTSLVDVAHQSLEELQACWGTLQRQPGEIQAHQSEVKKFQGLYKVVLQNVCTWLDNTEPRLLRTGYEEDRERHLEDKRSLQEMMQILLDVMDLTNKAPQELMIETGVEKLELNRQAVQDLLHRLKSLWSKAMEKVESQQGEVTENLILQEAVQETHVMPEQAEPVSQTQMSLNVQISPDGASHHFTEENMTVIIPPNCLDHSEDPCTISIVPEEPKMELTPDAESKIYEFLPSGLTTRNRIIFAIPLLPTHSYDYDNLTLMYRQDRDSEFVAAETMKSDKPTWVFCGSVCYVFLSHFCGVYIKRKHLFSKTPISVTMESLLFFKYTSPVLELKTTFGCYSAESACSTQKVKQHYTELGYDIAEQRRVLLKKGSSLTVEPKYCPLDWKPKFTGDGKEVRDDTVFMNMCKRCSTTVDQWPENFSHRFYQLEELSDSKQDITVWLDQQPHLKTFLSQSVSQLATESIYASQCIRPLIIWSDIDSDGKIKEIFYTQMSKEDILDCARVMAVHFSQTELSVREFTEIFLHEFMSRYHGPKDKVSVLCALIVHIGHFPCLEKIRPKLQNVIQIGTEKPSEQHQQPPQQRELEADTDDVHFKHPVLQKHKDDLIEHLNPNYELVERLMHEEILSQQEERKLSLSIEKGDLQKEELVKPVLRHVRNVDSDGLCKFIEALKNCDPIGTNAVLGGVIQRSYEEWIVGENRRRP